MDNGEEHHFDEPVFNVKTISIYNPKPKVRIFNSATMTIAEKYLFDKWKKEKEPSDGE